MFTFANIQQSVINLDNKMNKPHSVPLYKSNLISY